MAARPAEAKLAGTSLVEASAGTGKTHTITTLFLRLIVEKGLSVSQIVVVTFTEAATAELRGRIRRRLRQALEAFEDPSRASDDDLRAIATRVADRDEGRCRVEAALRELDLAAVSTIHAFCLRALQERAFESGARFGLELTPDTSELAREIAEDYWSSRMVPMAPDLHRIARKALDLKTTRTLVDAFSRRAPDVPILPIAPPAGVEETLRPALAKAFAAARTTWRAHGKRVRTLLLGAKKELSQAKDGYIEANVTRWCDELDALFATETPSFSLPGAVRMLSRRTLEDRAFKKKSPPDHAFFAEAEALADIAERAGVDLVLGLKHELAGYVRREMAARKAARGVQGFDDLLMSLDRALVGDGGERGEALARALRGQYKAALIDEFQDTDPVQFRIFRRVFHDERTPLLFVGDPKQSIYAFRGADVFSYFQAAKDAAGAPYTLDTNRRSDPSLVRAVNTIFERADKPFVFDEIEFHPVKAHAESDRLTLAGGKDGPDGKEGKPFEILFLPRGPGQDSPHNKGALGKLVPGLVAAEIVRFLASGARIEGRPVRAGDVAVLTRTNKQARAVQDALRALEVPTVLESEASVFESLECGELEQVLRAVLEPTRTGVLRSALGTSIVGLSAEAIVALEADESGWQAWSERFRAIQEVWASRGFMTAYRGLLRDLGVEPRLLSYVDGERRVTNLLHLGDLLHSASRRERRGLSGLVRWLGAMRSAPHETGLLEGEAAELRLESDARAVKLLTIHKSKGLEFPIVYCPYLWDAAVRPKANEKCLPFHDANDDHRPKLHLAPKTAPDAVAAAEREDQAEVQRLLYVALTRAKHRCSIVWGAVNHADASCLAYTLHSKRASASWKDVSDRDLRADLRVLEEASKGAVGVRDLDLNGASPPPYRDGDEREGGELRARHYDRAIDRWWRIGSFSAMTSGAHSSVGAPEAEGRDRDEIEEVAIEASAPEAERRGRDEVGDHAASEGRGEGSASSGGALPERVLLHDFPRGTKAGTMLHAVLEDHDFTDRDPVAHERLVREKLAAFGYGDKGLEPALAAAIDAMLDTPLGIGARLRDIPRARRIDELEFLLPVTQEPRTQVTAKAIAAAFAKHRTDAVPRAYVDEQLAKLGFLPLRGFLRGFIDLVFEHEGRFYVVDYKSNHLGVTASDYASARLAPAMSHANYFLQYHLYTLAVHRWLERRMRGYDYDRAFGGVLYLFARGMHPSHPAGTGIFFDRPTRAMVEALSEMLDHG